MRNNQITNSGKVGILFRDDARGRDFWPNRNLVEANRIVNSGGANGVAIDIKGKTRDLRIIDNQIRETRAPMHRIGIRIGKQAGEISLKNNLFAGFSRDVDDQRDRS